jgi:TatD DNase family protein
MRLIDTHCHLDLYPDYRAVLDEVERDCIYTIAVTNAPSVFSRCTHLTRDARYVRTALELHPELAAARERELPMFRELLPRTRYVGEVGWIT